MQSGSGMAQLKKCGKQRQGILQRAGVRHKKREQVITVSAFTKIPQNATLLWVVVGTAFPQ